ncbi:MAG TPA: lyase family protein, partial [Gemmatimonadaceae bacterium]
MTPRKKRKKPKKTAARKHPVPAPPQEAEAGPHKLWGGRFSSGPHPALDAVNRSIAVDFRLWPFDVRLSRAWAAALAKADVLTSDEAARIRRGLDAVARRFENGAQPVSSDEDIHTMIDRLLHEEIGGVASRLHTGRSRNDQVATATRLWTIEACARLDVALRTLQRAMLSRAATLHDAIMPAYTHLQRAQPVSAAHWLLSHFWPVDRDRRRLAAARTSAAELP